MTSLDATFASRLRSHAAKLGAAETTRSRYQISIGRDVADYWLENFDKLGMTQEEYYAQVSAVINESGLLVSDSGRTVRSWVDAVKRFDADTITALTAEGITMSHMTAAVRLYNAGHVASPLVALTMAVANRWSADDMKDALTPEPAHGWGVEMMARYLNAWPRVELPERSARRLERIRRLALAELGKVTR